MNNTFKELKDDMNLLMQDKNSYDINRNVSKEVFLPPELPGEQRTNKNLAISKLKIWLYKIRYHFYLL